MDRLKELYFDAEAWVRDHPKFSTFAALVVGGILIGAFVF